MPHPRSAASLVAACNNRAPPRVPAVGPRRSLADPPPSRAPPPISSFPATLGAHPLPPPMPTLPPAAPPLRPSAEELEAEELEADIAEAIRRSLLISQGGDVDGAAGEAGDAVGDADDVATELTAPSAGVTEAPSAPPLADAVTDDDWGKRKAAAARRRAEEEEQALCVICLTNGRTAGLLHGSTMHAVVCADCAPLVVGKPCPICRAPVERIIAFFG